MDRQSTHSPDRTPEADDPSAWFDNLLGTGSSTRHAAALTAPSTQSVPPLHRSGAMAAATPDANAFEDEARYGRPESVTAFASEDSMHRLERADGEEAREGGAVHQCLTKLMHMSPLMWLRVVVLCACVLGGQATEIIVLNFWLRQFPAQGADGEPGVAGNYTIFAVSGVIFFLFFLLLFGVYVVVRRPDLRFMREPRAWGLLMRAAAMDTLTSALSIYAASHTPEVLQALFVSMVPLYASLFTKLFLRDHRHYCNAWVLMSFACIVAGVFVATTASLGGGGVDNDGSDASSSSGGRAALLSDAAAEPDSAAHQRWWALLFCAAIPLEVLMGIFQTLFMLRYTHDPDLLTYVANFIVEDDDRRRGRVRPGEDVRGSYRHDRVTAADDGAPLRLFFGEEDGEEREWSAHAPQSGRVSNVYRHPGSVARLAPLRGPFSSHSHQRRTMPAMMMTMMPTRDAALATRHTAPPQPALVSVASTPAVARAPEDPRDTSAEDSGDAWMLSAGRLRPTGDDTTVKLTMLCLQTLFQCVFTLMWLPMDALPWYGGSSSVSEAWTNLIRGLDCLFNCPNNLAYGALYSAGFVLVYIGAAYLNQYSVTLCAMVSQLSGPVTALLLIVFPALNVTGDAAPWYVSLVAVCLLVAGTFVYVVWDEKTASIKEAGELELKLDMHGLANLAARRAEYVTVDVEG